MQLLFQVHPRPALYKVHSPSPSRFAKSEFDDTNIVIGGQFRESQSIDPVMDGERFSRANNEDEHKTCWKCGYNVSGSICPMCGAVNKTDSGVLAELDEVSLLH